MPFYVPVGPRGIVFRVGMMMITVLGSWTYWRHWRRRALRGGVGAGRGPGPALTANWDRDSRWQIPDFK